MARYIKKESYPLSKVFPHVIFLDNTNCKRHKVDFDGDLISVGSQRLQLFLLKGVKCVECGLEGKYFTKEKSKGNSQLSYHFNLYAWDDVNKCEVMITKDHIIPASKGGKDHLANFQPMCKRCNRKKDITMPDEKTVRIIKDNCRMKLKTYVKNYFKEHFVWDFNVDLNN